VPIKQITSNSIATNAITADKIATGAITNGDISDAEITGAKLANSTVTAAKLHTTAVTDKLGYTPANAANLTNVENKSSSTIRSEISSSNVTTALGYTPVNKTGDTITGNLLLGTASSTAFGVPFDDASFKRIVLENTYSSTSVGPNKIQMHLNSASGWVGGFGISDNTVAYYSGGHHKFYKSTNTTSYTQVFGISPEGYITTPSQPHIYGSPGAGASGASAIADRFTSKTSRGLSFSNSRITVPIAGVYLITFQTIASNTTGRNDTNVRVNGVTYSNGLNEDNGTGFHQRTHSFTVYLSANDYIQFNHQNWYATGNAFDEWQTASVTLLG
jgi:hypothetical protein